MSSLAEQYEQKYPNTGCSEAQKEERMQREQFKNEWLSMRRTGKNRGIVVPRLPWLEGAE
jgi:hypothetical protein